MKIRERTARDLLLAMGFEHAGGYAVGMLSKRLATVEEGTTDRQKMAVKHPALKRLLRTVIQAVKNDDEIEIVTEEEERLEKATDKTVETFGKKMEREQARVSVKTQREVLVGADDDGAVQEGDEKEPNVEKAKEILKDELEEEKPKKRGYEDKSRWLLPEKPQGWVREYPEPGQGTVRRAVFEMLEKASEQKPVTKEDILKSVKRKFKHLKESSLKSTVDGFPYWLPKAYPYSVHQTDRKYWIVKLEEAK
jgi:hypothetical protein